MDENESRLDVNQAGHDELCQVPGIGQTLANRIISGRPYEKMDDLLKLQGINASQLVKWMPLLTVHSISTPVEIMDHQSSDAGATPTVDEADALPQKSENTDPAKEENSDAVEIPASETTLNKNNLKTVPELLKNLEPPERMRKFADELPGRLRQRWAQSTPLSQVEALVWGAGGGLLVLILAVIFALGILAGINGSLSFVTSTRYAELQSQATVLSLQLKQVQLDTDSLRERMNALEGLSGRVTTVEKENNDLKTQINATVQEIQSLSAQSKQLEGEITTLKERSLAYDQFLGGLKTLLDTVVPKTAQ
jgi:hypothetical protein